ncbi:MAG: hypothetical protein FWE70_03805 [Oscillospiraceae bacterium]|nr:hypothetical protein [Oscillospiraceae bacterium]
MNWPKVKTFLIVLLMALNAFLLAFLLTHYGDGRRVARNGELASAILDGRGYGLECRIPETTRSHVMSHEGGVSRYGAEVAILPAYVILVRNMAPVEGRVAIVGINLVHPREFDSYSGDRGNAERLAARLEPDAGLDSGSGAPQPVTPPIWRVTLSDGAVRHFYAEDGSEAIAQAP